MERETGFEPATLALARQCSTTELFPHNNWLRGLDLNQRPLGYEPNELPGCSTPRQNQKDAMIIQLTCAMSIKITIKDRCDFSFVNRRFFLSNRKKHARLLSICLSGALFGACYFFHSYFSSYCIPIQNTDRMLSLPTCQENFHVHRFCGDEIFRFSCFLLYATRLSTTLYVTTLSTTAFFVFLA